MTYSAPLFHLLALLCTLCVEGVGMALWAVISSYPRPWFALCCAIGVNLLVHTLFWYSQPTFAAAGSLGLLRGEFLVVLLEGILYARLLKLKGVTPWLLSFALNLASFLTGIYLWQILL